MSSPPIKERDDLKKHSTLIEGWRHYYPLILGFVIIDAGVALTDTLIKSNTGDHSELKTVAGDAKFVLSILPIIGAGAIFATFPGVTQVIANISWVFVIALAIMLVPLRYAIVKRSLEKPKRLQIFQDS
ncbi:MAG: hypothetical protein ACM3JE_02430 [Betaproteobacteria bacterium]